MTDRRTFVTLAAGLLLASPSDTRSQGQASARRVGFLSAFARTEVDAFLGELRVGLERLGWMDGRNIVLAEVRTTEGRNDRLPSLAAELVAEAPDLILVQSTPAVLALKQATTSIPVVMIGVGNPVENGLVADLRKPGGNVTGSSYLADESVRKLLQLLKEAAPRLRSVALFANPTNPAAAAAIAKLRADAAAYGMRLHVAEVSSPEDFARAFSTIRQENAESVLIPPEPLVRTNRERIAGFAQADRLPLVVAGSKRYLPASGLMSFGPTTTQYALVTARYIDQILKGAKAGDLPIEQPSKFELVIDAAIARSLGLVIPASLLQRADEVIR